MKSKNGFGIGRAASGTPPDAPDRKAKTGRRIRNATACLDVQTHGNGKLVLADRSGYDIINVEKRMDLPARRWGKEEAEDDPQSHPLLLVWAGAFALI